MLPINILPPTVASCWGTKPSANLRTVAYVCTCHQLGVWRLPRVNIQTPQKVFLLPLASLNQSNTGTLNKPDMQHISSLSHRAGRPPEDAKALARAELEDPSRAVLRISWAPISSGLSKIRPNFGDTNKVRSIWQTPSQHTVTPVSFALMGIHTPSGFKFMFCLPQADLGESAAMLNGEEQMSK